MSRFCPDFTTKLSRFCPDFAQKGLSRFQFWLTKGSASVEEIIALKDADAIKRKRASTQAVITVVRNGLAKILVKKVDGGFDHANIQRVRVEAEHKKLVYSSEV